MHKFRGSTIELSIKLGELNPTLTVFPFLVHITEVVDLGIRAYSVSRTAVLFRNTLSNYELGISIDMPKVC
ncbi:hypothetical protein [Pseudoalteromonas luteoviolacea]|uniref:hypothetical protein n=1 Tax=Pseudoalteromonas luteoviolacea TaxID=43657 RepID=UPI0012DAF226|nr:hypothetical protein [Pseudoalteromonas luteoviolacea]